MSDFRQAAIEALKALEEKPKALEDDYDFGRRQMLETCIDIIQDLQPSPSAQTERKRGKWIELDSDGDLYDEIMCPHCRREFTVDAYHWTDIGFTKSDLKFCPNCGAKMEG